MPAVLAERPVGAREECQVHGNIEDRAIHRRRVGGDRPQGLRRMRGGVHWALQAVAVSSSPRRTDAATRQDLAEETPADYPSQGTWACGCHALAQTPVGHMKHKSEQLACMRRPEDGAPKEDLLLQGRLWKDVFPLAEQTPPGGRGDRMKEGRWGPSGDQVTA